MAPEPDDQQLLERSRSGCETSFAELFRRHQGRVYRFALHMSGSESVAEETVQEVFVAVLENSGRYQPARGAVSAWLLGIARNKMLQLFYKERDYLPAPEGEEIPAQGDLLADMTRLQAIEAVNRAVLSLPANYREVVALCDLEELDYTEAAQVLGCPVGTVRSRLSRARQLLYRKLAGTLRPAAMNTE
jgi:RNA polymerase sigma-70 factor (ECF subfamily)